MGRGKAPVRGTVEWGISFRNGGVARKAGAGGRKRLAKYSPAPPKRGNGELYILTLDEYTYDRAASLNTRRLHGKILSRPFALPVGGGAKGLVPAS